jgi:hypothetical protein
MLPSSGCASYLPACLLVFAELISSTLKIEVICFSETSVNFQRTTRRYIPEDGTLHNHRCENLTSCTVLKLCFGHRNIYCEVRKRMEFIPQDSVSGKLWY